VIAVGTSDDLKDRIGGEVLELHLVDAAETARAADALVGVGSGKANVDAEAGVIRLPVGDAGPAVTLESTRHLDDLSIRLSGFALHRPTLDDVFLSLTGHAAEVDAGSEPSAKGRRRRRERKDS
jgi:ABC-2 type transport system ATP-binding protein